MQKEKEHYSFFEILAKMHDADCKSESKLVQFCPHFLSVDKIPQGAKVSMGTPESVLYDLMEGNHKALLLIVNWEEYTKIKEDYD